MKDYLVSKRYKEQKKAKLAKNTGTKRSFDRELMDLFV